MNAIEIRWNGVTEHIGRVQTFLGRDVGVSSLGFGQLILSTEEGDQIVNPGDWISKDHPPVITAHQDRPAR